MKTLFYTFLLTILFSFNCKAQVGTTINFKDNAGAETLNFTGIVNGKYSYEGLYNKILWSSANNRWEIIYYTDFGDLLIFHSDEETSMNPPNLTVGNWQPEDPTDTLITLSGSGTTGSLLPIQLASFSNKMIGNIHYLNWRTTTEKNNQKFEIEQSIDGIHFNKIGEIQGSGSTLKPQQYRFDLQNFLNTNISFFRLKQIDFDGSFSYSHILSISKKEQPSFVFPNPSTNGMVYLNQKQSHKTNENRITILDHTGRIIRQINNDAQEGNHLLNIDVSDLNAGIYFIQLKQGNNKVLHKVIVN